MRRRLVSRWGEAMRPPGWLPGFSNDGTRLGLVVAGIFAAGAVSSAYLPLWMADRGMDARQIGFVLGVATMLRVAGGPAGGWVADRAGRRVVLIGAGFVAAVAAGVLPGLGGVTAILLAIALLGMATTLLAPLADAMTLVLAAAGRLDYGRTRVWGSVAYMVAAAAGGWLLSRTGSGSVPVVLFTLYGLTGLFACWVPDVAVPAVQGGEAAAGGAGGPLRQASFRWALLATALIQGSHAAYYSFAPLHWRAAGLSDTVIGLLIAEGIVAEVALFAWGGALVKRLGPARLTALGAAACMLRWTALAFVTAWQGLVVLQFLHAATFAFQHMSTMMVLQRMPPGRAGMAQTLMSALGFSAATGALVWVTGQLYAGWGGGVFLLMAGVGGAALAVVRPLGLALRRQGGVARG